MPNDGRPISDLPLAATVATGDVVPLFRPTASTPATQNVGMELETFLELAADNLGNHTATQDLQLGPHALRGTDRQVRVDGQLRLDGTAVDDPMFFKGGVANGSGSIAFDASGEPMGTHVSARVKFKDDGNYGADIVFEINQTGAAGLVTTEVARFTPVGLRFADGTVQSTAGGGGGGATPFVAGQGIKAGEVKFNSATPPVFFTTLTDKVGPLVEPFLPESTSQVNALYRKLHDDTELRHLLASKAPTLNAEFAGTTFGVYPSITADKRQFATQGYVIDKAARVAVTLVNDVLTSFTSFAEAQNASTSGEVFLYGYHGDIDIDRSLRVVGGTARNVVVGYGSYFGLTVTVTGTRITRRAVACPASYGATSVTWEDIGTGPDTYFESFGLGTAGGLSNRLNVTLRRVNALFGGAYSAAGQGSGFYRFQERDGQCSYVRVEDCRLQSVNGPIFSGYGEPPSVIEYVGSTALQPAGGHAAQEVGQLNSGSYYADADLITDARTSGLTLTAGDVYDLIDHTQGNVEVTVDADKLVLEAPSGTGGIDYAAPVTVNATQALQANKAHFVTGAGYALPLPNPALTPGAAVFVRIADNATGLYPLTGTAYVLYAGESLLLRETGGAWKKTGGELLPMSVRLETVSTQQDAFTQFTYTLIPFSVVARNNALPALVNLPGRAIVVQRAAMVTISAAVVIKNGIVNGLYYAVVRSRLGGVEKDYAGTYATVESTNNFGVASLNITTPVVAGEVLTVELYTPLAQGNLLGDTICYFTFAELL